ncbi:MAG TPA: Maf family nucleotide pyrophosphatase [Burkholderiales bacterium]|nr:Maf family nucleotide pyrophosphatase [Burkholderiales bacterium]
MQLVLASTSPYRRALLERLGLPFTVAAPDVAEERLPGEPADAMAVRLARAKALAVASAFPSCLVIGSDQVAECEGRFLGKPGTRERARAQLRALSGREAVFHTAVCVHGTAARSTLGRVVPSRVRFRTLDDATIERYLEREPAYDCAGSAKVEGLGIALLERVESDDPTALVGLPLIALVSLLREHGCDVV